MQMINRISNFLDETNFNKIKRCYLQLSQKSLTLELMLELSQNMFERRAELVYIID